MIHIKDKSLFSLKILSFEYIKLKLKNSGQQDDHTELAQYPNEAYSYQVLSRVADIDDSFDQIKASSTDKDCLVPPHDVMELVERCYLLVGTAIGMEEDDLQPGHSKDNIKSALKHYPKNITSKLKKIESVANYSAKKHHQSLFIYKDNSDIDDNYSMSYENIFDINDLHQSVADLQVSLTDVFSMKLNRIH